MASDEGINMTMGHARVPEGDDYHIAFNESRVFLKRNHTTSIFGLDFLRTKTALTLNRAQLSHVQLEFEDSPHPLWAVGLGLGVGFFSGILGSSYLATSLSRTCVPFFFLLPPVSRPCTFARSTPYCNQVSLLLLFCLTQPTPMALRKKGDFFIENPPPPFF